MDPNISLCRHENERNPIITFIIFLFHPNHGKQCFVDQNECDICVTIDHSYTSMSFKSDTQFLGIIYILQMLIHDLFDLQVGYFIHYDDSMSYERSIWLTNWLFEPRSDQVIIIY